MITTPDQQICLVADIGGTNTRVALAQKGILQDGSIRRYKNASYDTLGQVLRQYFSDQDISGCGAACVALAGPVKDGVGTMTNLSWTMDLDTLRRVTGAQTVAILNDLQAQGHALGHISEANLHSVIPPLPDTPATGNQLVIGVGTGFNIAPVHQTEFGRVVAASETGHARLPVSGPDDLALCDMLAQDHGFPAIEDALSGRGLAHLYRFAARQAAAQDGASPAPALSAADIMMAVADKTDPCAEAALAHFVRLLASVSGDLALAHLPFGGIFLVGGVSQHIAPHLTRLGFAQHFRDKGRYGPFLAQIPVSVVSDDYAALTGCAAYLDARPA